MFPAPGVYDGDTTPTSAISVWQFTIPSNVDVGAWTSSIGAVIVDASTFAWIETSGRVDRDRRSPSNA